MSKSVCVAYGLKDTEYLKPGVVGQAHVNWLCHYAKYLVFLNNFFKESDFSTSLEGYICYR